MALVVLLRGINVGGHRRFRPSRLAAAFARFEVVNVGAAGTFVVRKTVSPAKLRAAIARRLPFEAQVMICEAREVLRVAARHPFQGTPNRPDIIRFVSVLAKAPPAVPALPLALPGKGRWVVKILSIRGRFVFGLHRREMKAISALGALDELLGTPATTRSWSTIEAIAMVLQSR